MPADSPQPAFQLIGAPLCLELINTMDKRGDPEREKELLPTYAEVLAFARQMNILSARERAILQQISRQHPLKAAEARRDLIELRECLYRIFDPLSSGHQPSTKDLEQLSQVVQKAMSHLHLQRQNGGFELDWPRPENALNFLAWRAARSAAELLTSSDLGSLKLCDCGWYFLDRSKNHSRRWCDMKICGNRQKARRYYQKSRETK
jgi:predicted RNA-binding Zn ribbon-like protein